MHSATRGPQSNDFTGAAASADTLASHDISVHCSSSDSAFSQRDTRHTSLSHRRGHSDIPIRCRHSNSHASRTEAHIDHRMTSTYTAAAVTQLSGLPERHTPHFTLAETWSQCDILIRCRRSNSHASRDEAHIGHIMTSTYTATAVTQPSPTAVTQLSRGETHTTLHSRTDVVTVTSSTTATTATRMPPATRHTSITS